MNFIASNFFDSLRSGISYIPATFLLVIVPVCAGFILGSLIALARLNKVPVIGRVLAAFVTIYQGVPIAAALLVYQLLFLTQFDKVAALLHLSVKIKDINIIWVGIFALSLQAICMMSETIRGAFLSVDSGQWEAGYCVGLTKWQTTYRIIIPQMVSEAIPNLISIIVGLLKNSSIVMSIGIAEITFGVGVPAMITYSYFEAYLAAAVIYWVITIMIEYSGSRLEKHMKRYRSVGA